MFSVDEVCQKYRVLGVRITPQRRGVFKALEGNLSHPSADEVYREVSRDIPEVSLTTVYKILHELVEMGELVLIEAGGKQRFDPGRENHGHLYCSGCSGITDLSGISLKGVSSLELSLGEGEVFFRLDERQPLLLYGKCPSCL